MRGMNQENARTQTRSALFTRRKAVIRLHRQGCPATEARAKTTGGEIHWGDETALVNADVRGRSFAARGKTPVVYAVDSTRQKLSNQTQGCNDCTHDAARVIAGAS